MLGEFGASLARAADLAQSALQGILLTVEVLGFFIAAMLLLARIRSAAIGLPAGGAGIPSAFEELA